jgi:hypothetical protein
MKRKLVIGTILFLILISAIFIYNYYPRCNTLYQVSKINKSIEIAGIKLLMPLDEVTGKMISEGNYIYGMGGYGYEYENEKIRVFFSNDSDGLAYNKVCFIETENPNHQVLNIHPGSSLDKAFSVLNKSGFRQEEKNYYKKGDVYVFLTSENNMVKMVRIGFIDRSLSGRVY